MTDPKITSIKRIDQRPGHADPSPTGAPFPLKPVPRRPDPVLLPERGVITVAAGETAAVRWFWKDMKAWSAVEYRQGPCRIVAPLAATYRKVEIGPSQMDGKLDTPSWQARKKTKRRQGRRAPKPSPDAVSHETATANRMV